jgi:predicted  nucleic acid-binding Zn-ribbon protein
MGLSSEMKNLSEEILNSFKLRLKENEDLVNDVQKTLDGFHKDHMEMAAVLNARAANLRKGLATGEKERLATFDNLMSGIHNTITSLKGEVAAIQTSTASMVNEFAANRSQMADELNKFFAEGKADRMQNESTRMKEFDALMKNINDEIKGINEEVFNIIKDTNDMLTRFDTEHHEMSAELRAELGRNLTERVNYTRSMLKGFQKRLAEISKENQQMAQNLRKGLKQGETLRLKDYNSIMKGIHASIKEIRREVMNIQQSTSGMIDHLSKDRDQAAAYWQKMQDTIAQLRKTGITKTAKKAEKKNEILNEPTPEIIVDEQILAISPEMAVETQERVNPMSLEEKVLAFVNKHPGGVKVLEMESPLGETRMKLGYTAKALLNEGKVQKLDNIYFPVK